MCEADAASPGLLEAALMARAGSSVEYSLGVNIYTHRRIDSGVNTDMKINIKWDFLKPIIIVQSWTARIYLQD